MLSSNMESPLVLSESSSFDESSSSEPFESSGSTTLYFGGPNMWYNVPDGLERNPDIIRAEMSLMATPMNQLYAAEAYGAVKNVQNVCAADYKTFCGSPSIDLSAVSAFLDSFMMPRLLTERKPHSEGSAMVNKLRSYYRELDNKAVVIPKHGAHIKTGNLRKVNKVGARGLLQLLDKEQGPPPGKDGPPPRGPPPQGPPPRGPPPPPEDSMNYPYPPREKGPEEEGSTPQPPPPGPSQDFYYNGALGFGAEGDLCLYENFNQLSEPCVQGMADLYDVRQRFWHDNEEYGHNHLFVIIIGALFVWMMVKKCIWRKKIQKVRTFMDAVHANPALKATIEAETGMQVPEMPCRRSRCCEDKEKKDKCFLKKLCKYVAAFVFVFVVSFFMAVTSLEITGNILANWDADAEAAGQEPNTSPLTALLLLLTVTLIEVTIFTLAVRVGKHLCAMACGSGSSSNCDSECPAPSAPPASPVVVHMTPMPTPQIATASNGGAAAPRRFQWGRALTVNPFSRMFSNNGGATAHGEYTALSGGEEETEMVTVTPSVPQPFLTPVLMSNGQTILAVSAAPVTKVNLV